MLLSCETGQERKCLRDGLDILLHYYKRLVHTSKLNRSDVNLKQGHTLTLEQEIQLLKAGKSVDSVLERQDLSSHDTIRSPQDEPFQLYETGVAGTVLIMYKTEVRHDEEEVGEQPLEKRLKLVPWDPIETMTTIMQHLKYPDTCEEPPPRSRFVTRMIPLQATCFASMEEIAPIIRTLLNTYVLPQGMKVHQLRQIDPHIQTPSFKVDFRRRYCSHITRELFIDCVIQTLSTLIQEFPDIDKTLLENPMEDATKIVNTIFRVDLSKPDFTVMAEICRNVCGISVVRDACTFHNFNLIEAGTPLI